MWALADVCVWPILLQKSEIGRPQKSRESRFLDAANAAMSARGDTKAGGRFCMKRYGPSCCRVRNASVVVRIFVLHLKTIFSRLSALFGLRCFSQCPLCGRNLCFARCSFCRVLCCIDCVPRESARLLDNV